MHEGWREEITYPTNREIELRSNHSRLEQPTCHICKKKINVFHGDLEIHHEGDDKPMCKDCSKELFPEIFVGNTPMDYYNYMTSYIVGHDHIKRSIAVAINERIKNLDTDNFEDSNILIFGPEGSGKTLFANIIGRMIKDIYTVVDAASFIETEDVEDNMIAMFTPLVEPCLYDINRIGGSIIFIDNIDALIPDGNYTMDSRKIQAQNFLIRMMNGRKTTISNFSRSCKEVKYAEIDTSNVRFICAGRLSGLEEVIHDNPSAYDHDIHGLITRDDFTKSGLLGNFFAQIHLIYAMKPLSKEDLLAILYHPLDCLISQYGKSFAYNDSTLEFTDDAINAIADKAYAIGTGGYALKTVMQESLTDALLGIASLHGNKKVKVDEDTITSGTWPNVQLYSKNGWTNISEQLFY